MVGRYHVPGKPHLATWMDAATAEKYGYVPAPEPSRPESAYESCADLFEFFDPTLPKWNGKAVPGHIWVGRDDPRRLRCSRLRGEAEKAGIHARRPPQEIARDLREAIRAVPEPPFQSWHHDGLTSHQRFLSGVMVSDCDGEIDYGAIVADHLSQGGWQIESAGTTGQPKGPPPRGALDVPAVLAKVSPPPLFSVDQYRKVAKMKGPAVNGDGPIKDDLDRLAFEYWKVHGGNVAAFALYFGIDRKHVYARAERHRKSETQAA